MLDKLEVLKKTFDKKIWPELASLLDKLSKHRFKNAESLIRFHECLMFMLAYPQNKKLLVKTKSLLKTIPERIKQIERTGTDMSAFEEFENAGIAGTSITLITGYKFAQWLAVSKNIKSEIDWDGYEDEDRITALLPRIVPYSEEETMVEPHVPFVDYIRKAKGKKSYINFITDAISGQNESEKRKAELYEGLKLYIKISPDFGSSRTGLRIDEEETFFHSESLIQRRNISLKEEISKLLSGIQKISVSEGAGILEMIRKSSVVRFRELHGFIWGDPGSFLKIDLGRGVILYINEVFPENRLPLRAYHSGFMLKNGVPVGYVETLSMFERMEVGFNLYYTFREGETAWMYAQLLRVFHQYLGATIFSIDPYQIGHENEEGIKSGAFWFYKKLGFRPVNNSIAKIVRNEENKILNNKKYKTTDRILRHIATSHMLYIFNPGDNSPEVENVFSEWKDFHLRNVLQSVQKKVSENFFGNMLAMMKASINELSDFLNIDCDKMNQDEKDSFMNFAVLLYNTDYKTGDKKLLLKIIESKVKSSEADYLMLMRKHPQLREIILKFGHRH